MTPLSDVRAVVGTLVQVGAGVKGDPEVVALTLEHNLNVRA